MLTILHVCIIMKKEQLMTESKKADRQERADMRGQADKQECF